MWIRIPEEITLVSLETGEPMPKDFERNQDGSPNPDKPIADTPWPIQKFLARFVYTNPYLGNGDEDSAELVWRLRNAFYPKNYIKARSGHSWTEVADADVKAVRELLSKPNGDGKKTQAPIPWPNVVMAQLVPHMRAFADARREPPPDLIIVMGEDAAA